MLSRIINVILGGLILAAGMTLYFTPNPYAHSILKDLPKVGSINPNPNAPFPPIIRLTDEKHSFFCTAVVFDGKYAVTAAHCLAREYGLMTTKIFIEDDKGVVRGEGVAAGVNYRTDFGIVKGDFSKFQWAILETQTAGLMEPGLFITCGFAFGQKPITCTPFKPINIYGFAVYGYGALVPGMSGGPVINVSTGKVVAVNSAVGEGKVYVTPLTGLLGAFQLQ